MEMRFALCKERERARLERGKNKLQHRQSRWLSKERGCGRGKRDRCQNKGDSKSGPKWDAKDRIEGRPLADFARGKQEWGRIVRMELDYTRQCSTASFTLSIYICSVFEWAVGICSNGKERKVKNRTLKTAGMRHPG